jgi:hypothetical protein
VSLTINTLNKFLMDFVARQGARKRHSGRYGDDKQRSIAMKGAEMTQRINGHDCITTTAAGVALGA